MAEVYNVQYYNNLWQGYKEFAKNNETRLQQRVWLNPQSLLIQPICNVLTNGIMTAATFGYTSTGSLVEKGLSWVSPWAAKKFADTWEDPIPTKVILLTGKVAETLSKPIATLNSNWKMGRVTISAAQHIHILAKDTQAIFTLPEYFHNLSDTRAADQESRSMVGKVGVWIKHKIELVLNTLIILIGKVMTALSPWIPFAGTKASWVERQVNSAALDLYQNVLNMGHKQVNETEMYCRKLLVHAGIRNGLSSAINFGLYSLLNGAFAYYVLYPISRELGRAVSEQSGVEIAEKVNWVVSKGTFLGEISLWLKCISPTMQRLDRSYQSNYIPNSSTIEEIHTLFSIIDFIGLGAKGDLNKFADVVKHADTPINLSADLNTP